MRNLPSDIYRESLNRLPLVQREDLDERSKRLYDATTDPAGGSLAGLQGPTGIWLHSPKIAGPLSELNRVLRTQTDLGPRLTELAILVAAREMDHQFEWTMHEPAALKAGLESTIIDIVKYRRPITGLGTKETLIISLGRELMQDRRLTPRTYAETIRAFGITGAVDLVTLMAQYAATAFVLNAFDQQLHSDQRPLLPTR